MTLDSRVKGNGEIGREFNGSRSLARNQRAASRRKNIGLKIRELVTGRPIDELQPQVLSRVSIRFSTVFGA